MADQAKHIQGKLHRHGEAIHIYTDKPLNHTCIAVVNNGLDKILQKAYGDEILRRWNTHAKLVEACKHSIAIFRSFNMKQLCTVIEELEAALAEVKP
jgi:hypothetical protein